MKQKGFAPIIIILVVAILGTVGYFVYKSHIGPKGTILGPYSPDPIAIVTTDPIANWGTFTDNEWKVTLKYPSEFKQSVKKDSSGYIGFIREATKDKSVQILIDIYENMYQNENTVNGVAKKYLDEQESIYSGSDARFSPIEVAKIGNQEGLSYSLVNNYLRESTMFVENKSTNKILIIATSFSEKDVDNQDLEMVNQILSTFKFTN